MKVYAVLSVSESRTELLLHTNEEDAVTDFCLVMVEEYGAQLEPDELAAALNDAKNGGLHLEAMTATQESVSINFFEKELDLTNANDVGAIYNELAGIPPRSL